MSLSIIWQYESVSEDNNIQFQTRVFDKYHDKLSKLNMKLLASDPMGYFPVYLPLFLKAHSQIWGNFYQLKALLKWWKMPFISPQKLFSFSRYLNFCLDFLVM